MKAIIWRAALFFKHSIDVPYEKQAKTLLSFHKKNNSSIEIRKKHLILIILINTFHHNVWTQKLWIYLSDRVHGSCVNPGTKISRYDWTVRPNESTPIISYGAIFNMRTEKISDGSEIFLKDKKSPVLFYVEIINWFLIQCFELFCWNYSL